MSSDKELHSTIHNLKHEIHRQKKELTESIRYASYIQKALLPSPLLFKKLLPDHFVLFQPKDIVSGDFFWITRKKSDIIIAVADCTGHGVPGAFMSILGITTLNEVINRGSYSSAGSILNQLREGIMKALNQTGEEYEQKDGIDMAICKLNTESNEIEYAGAFNPIYIIQNRRLTEIDGDKMPIGISAEEERPFKTHRFSLKPDNVIYLFTDGFVDQFGGAMGKKYKYQPFRKLILKIHELPMHKQKEMLLNEFEKWKGSHQQLDDLLIVGFRYQCG
ncbi:MAG: serine/threonine-protein phosphatase [Bacteroidales bacterium]|nr:serine/threonine-protein phosphatase [Bacteroidales bacterium]